MLGSRGDDALAGIARLGGALRGAVYAAGVAFAAGATVTSPVGDDHGWRPGRITGPFGHHWETGTPIGPPATLNNTARHQQSRAEPPICADVAASSIKTRAARMGAFCGPGGGDGWD